MEAAVVKELTQILMGKRHTEDRSIDEGIVSRITVTPRGT